jgi:hypothetical protein
MSKFTEKIARRLQGQRVAIVLAGFLQVSNKFLKQFLKVSNKSLASLQEVSKKSLRSL